MNKLIEMTLNKAGYNCLPTERNIINCFFDYINEGVWPNLSIDNVKQRIKDEDITIEDMCQAIINVGRI